MYAAGIELALAVAAVFGGPHGALGALPWIVNMPGILVIRGIPGEGSLFGRIALAVLIQMVLWYGVIAWIRRRRAASARSDRNDGERDG